MKRIANGEPNYVRPEKSGLFLFMPLEVGLAFYRCGINERSRFHWLCFKVFLDGQPVSFGKGLGLSKILHLS